MLVQIVTENGVKKIIPLTADAGAGNPVGTIIPMYKKSSPSGYLYCDGSTFDETKYPLLYAYLGSNVLPDYREFALVGAEENTTDVYNASTNPTGTIHDHDVYTEGQAKDDAIQNFKGNYESGTSQANVIAKTVNNGTYNLLSFRDMGNARTATVTRGKRKAVYFYIKATSGLSENAQDNVVAQINEQRSYSTEEHLTGRKWIDGKPTYERTFALSNVGTSYTINVNNLDTIINYYGNCIIGGSKRPYPFANNEGVNNINSYTQTTINLSNRFDMSELNITLEYTKTTD